MKVEIIFAHGDGHIIGEVIDGYILIKNKETVFLKGIELSIEGKTYDEKIETYTTTELYTDSDGNLQSRTVTYTVVIPIVNTIYESPKFNCFDEEYSNNMINRYIEYPPGIHKIPFSFTPPPFPCPTQIIRKKHIFIKYTFSANVMMATGEKVYEKELVVLFNPQTENKVTPQDFKPSNSKYEVNLHISNTSPNSGEIISIMYTIKNKSSSSLVSYFKIKNKFYGQQSLCKQIALFNLPKIPPKETVSNEVKYQIDPHYCTVGFGQWNSTYELKIKIKQNSIFSKTKDSTRYSLNIGWGLTTPEIMSQRAKCFGVKRDYNNYNPFYGSHDMPPPVFNNDPTLPPYIEKVTTFDEKETYYLNHLTRKTSKSPTEQIDCEYPYPNYESIKLPEGWFVGYIEEEKYYINFNDKTTQWINPQPETNRSPPYKTRGVGTFYVDVIDIIGLPVFTFGLPNVYVRLYSNQCGEPKETKVIKSPKYLIDTEKSYKYGTHVYLNNARHNVCIYLYSKNLLSLDKFLGSVNINLSQFPNDVMIEDWFQLKRNGDNKRSITGMIKLRIGYLINSHSQFDVPVIKCDCKSNYNKYYIPRTDKMKKQIEKQIQYREKKKLPPLPSDLTSILFE